MKYSSQWIPACECGSLPTTCCTGGFDQRFPVDRSFNIKGVFTRSRIRFVKHPDCPPDKIRVYTHNIWELFPFKKYIGQRLERFKDDWIHKILLLTQSFRMWDTEELLTKDEIEYKYGYKI